MKKELADWERKTYVRDTRTIFRASAELQMEVKMEEPSIEKQRLIEEMFFECFNKAQEIIEKPE